MKPNKVFSILILSSIIFITNVLSTLYKKQYFYSFLFGCLTLTSLIYHYNTNIYTNILAIVLYGGYVLYNKIPSDNYIKMLLILISFFCCIFFFFYGYYIKDYCYHPNKYVGNNYHCMLHIIASFGHHLITFL